LRLHRGAVEIDIDWTNGKASRVALKSPLTSTQKVRFADGRVETVKLIAGKETILGAR
jgi:hypothetical protein